MNGALLHRALGDSSRVAVLAALRASEHGLDAAELAAEVGLHANTVRAHLAVLEEAHLVVHRAERNGGRGRPRLVYASAHRPDAGSEAALLVELLDGLGFEPKLAGSEEEPELRMYRCPFGITPAAPEPHVCRAHAGMLRAAAKELGSPFAIGRLSIFPKPEFCALRLHRSASVETT